MATKKPIQEGKQALVGRLMLAMRRSSAAGVLHGQAIARKVGVNSSDLECLDLILLNGPSTAGEIARRTGLTSGAVTGLIDRLERLGLVERAADPDDRRKVLVRVREDKIAPIARPVRADGEVHAGAAGGLQPRRAEDPARFLRARRRVHAGARCRATRTFKPVPTTLAPKKLAAE